MKTIILCSALTLTGFTSLPDKWVGPYVHQTACEPATYFKSTAYLCLVGDRILNVDTTTGQHKATTTIDDFQAASMKLRIYSHPDSSGKNEWAAASITQFELIVIPKEKDGNFYSFHMMGDSIPLNYRKAVKIGSKLIFQGIRAKVGNGLQKNFSPIVIDITDARYDANGKKID